MTNDLEDGGGRPFPSVIPSPPLREQYLELLRLRAKVADAELRDAEHRALAIVMGRKVREER